MSKLKSSYVSLGGLRDVLIKLLQDEYGFPDSQTDLRLQRYLHSFRDDLWAYVEYPYVDRVYRNSYYTYFSTKHRQYARDSIRVSLFDFEITEPHFRDAALRETLAKGFLGYFTLRPTLPGIIGRSNVSPSAMKLRQFHCCTVETEAAINGAKLKVSSFPSSSQDSETIKCAETTVWGVMEYFGNKYAEYKPALPSSIVNALTTQTYERQLPSHGLTATQISFALREFGFGVRLYHERKFGSAFPGLFNQYIDSGIPFVATLENPKIGHAVIVAGQEDPSSTNIMSARAFDRIRTSSGEVELIDWSAIDRRFIAVDDNHAPYVSCDFSSPTAHYPHPDWANCRLTSAIVPLYSKIYLEALEAKHLAVNVLKSQIVNSSELEAFPEVVLRPFLTSSRSFKSKIAYDRHLGNDSKELILQTLMPKFVWVVELTDKQSACNRRSRGLVVLDATENDGRSSDALLFVALPETFVTVEKHEAREIKIPLNPFEMYSSNHQGGF
ncbi:MAG: hypothetical protein MUE68_07270 [Bacteroidetes bacterium]|jgi:hypothetical protein|nr:hypothetical protein [Bacteroidota bacterium]